MAIASTYPIGTSDGNEKYLGVQAGDGAVKQYAKPAGGGSGSTQALMETRTAAVAATIDVGVKSLRTAGYSTAGDRGEGLYKRVNALPTHSGYFRSVDRFTAAGATDATNGGYWELVPEMGAICIEQFGGKADYEPPGGDWAGTGAGTGTDNYAPWVAMMTMTDRTVGSGPSAVNYCPRHVYRAGSYYFSQTLIHTKVVKIQGVGSGRDMVGGGEGTTFVFPNNTTCMVFHSTTSGPGELEARAPNPLGGSSGGSIVEGFALWNEGDWPNTNRDKHGIRVRARIVARNISFYKMGGAGIYMWAQNSTGGFTEGVANDFHLENLQVQVSGLAGFYIRGNDANAGHAIGLETKAQGAENGPGLYDESGLGNVYMGCNFAGYGNSGVTHGGRWYILIDSGSESGSNIGSITTPGTNDRIWHDIGAGSVNANFPAWSGGDTYWIAQPVWIGGLSNRSVITYIYVEGWYPCHVEGPSLAIQGQCGFDRYSAAVQTQIGQGPFTEQGHGGQQRSLAGQPRHTYNGGNSYAYVGNSSGIDPDKGICLLSHNRDREGGNPYTWRYEDAMITYGRPYEVPFWQQTIGTSAALNGRTGTTPGRILFFDPMLRDTVGANLNITIGVRNAAPTTGEWKRGDRFYRENVVANGNEGWVCTASGSPGTWKEFGIIQA